MIRIQVQPGPGVGGHCIAVDPWFIVSKTPNDARIIRTAREVNNSKSSWVLDKVSKLVKDFLDYNQDRDIGDIKIACFGLAFKPDIDDVRESPALDITRNLAKIYPGSVIAVDPYVKKLEKESFALMDYKQAAKVADIAVLLVDHSYFIGLDRPKTRFFVDTRGIWN